MDTSKDALDFIQAITPANRLKIALVTETYPPEINGVAMTLGRLIDGLRQQGHRVQVIRPRQKADAGQQSADEILLRGLPIPGYQGLQFGLPATSRLYAEWQDNTPDVVHVVTEGPLGMSALKAAQRLDLPVTSSFHTNFHRYTRHYRCSWLRGLIATHLRRLHNRTAATFVPTAALATELGTDGFTRLQVMARGVDTELFRPERRSQALRQQWGIADDALAVIYVGRLAAEKNLRMVQTAFAAIEAHHPSARLIVVGDGPLGSRLRQNCPRAIFCGSRTGEDLATHYASGDIFLFPSLTETFGNVTTEALASGLGVVAYAHAAAAELIRNGDNGITVPAGDESAYVDAAVHLASHPIQLAKVRQAAAASVRHLGWHNIVKTFAGTLLSVRNRHRRSHYGKPDVLLAPD